MLLGSAEDETTIKLKGQMLYNNIQTSIQLLTYIMKYILSFAFWQTDKNQ